jgi:hypothetical protein
MTIPETYYDILQVSEDATPKEIRKSYRHLIKIFHPDIAGPSGVEMTIRLNEAEATLMNANKRADYDLELKLQRIQQRRGNGASYQTSEPSPSPDCDYQDEWGQEVTSSSPAPPPPPRPPRPNTHPNNTAPTQYPAPETVPLYSPPERPTRIKLSYKELLLGPHLLARLSGVLWALLAIVIYPAIWIYDDKAQGRTPDYLKLIITTHIVTIIEITAAKLRIERDPDKSWPNGDYTEWWMTYCIAFFFYYFLPAAIMYFSGFYVFAVLFIAPIPAYLIAVETRRKAAWRGYR